MNKLICIGYTGLMKCYLNITEREAIQRYIKSENISETQMEMDNNIQVNHIEFDQYKKYDLPICDRFLDRMDTRLTHPIHNYRGMTNDWFNQPRVNGRDEQCNIFWNFAENTHLTATDNYKSKNPVPMDPLDVFPIKIISNK